MLGTISGVAEPRPPEGSATVPQALGRLRVSLDDAFARSSRELGLTPQQAELLCAAMAPTAVGGLAGVLRCDRSNVSRLVDRAARRGLLQRAESDADGRMTIVELSPEGRDLAERFIESLESQLAPMLEEWPPRRRRDAARLLDRLADGLDASGA